MALAEKHSALEMAIRLVNRVRRKSVILERKFSVPTCFVSIERNAQQGKVVLCNKLSRPMRDKPATVSPTQGALPFSKGCRYARPTHFLHECKRT
ncbi:hypothetical protein [Aurantiacibacter aquimixticola]|uniref:hypothetical protein n=1 Tax=Aurantiacibacter aquimixticola TaxID=1958945 RepID=UPI001402F426|nr:hypothetical protein [Aurantiacibacter aquimixticola]